MTHDPHQLAARIKQRARMAGFDLVGIAPARPSAHEAYVREWFARKRHGSMQWLENRLDDRLDPAQYLDGARSVICVAKVYRTRATSPDMPAEGHLKIAEYARGSDYHEHIKPRLWDIADWIRETVPGARTLCGVDTVPVLERELAARSGIGWIGKNTLLIHPAVGSYTFLGEILTTLHLPHDDPMPDRCGTCTRCIDACPTQCIEPYQLDASRCISYLTIEHLDDLAENWRGKLDGWLYGCDVCQAVCPYNHKGPIAIAPELSPIVPSTVARDYVLNWSQDDYWRFTRRTAMRRVKLPQFRRNAVWNDKPDCR
jgi:epoxyqueuosine reductase